ncbi:MAG: TIGR02270 family protein [Fibrobacterota bacterium]|nr:TIGR02270 family protein [Fibrobacterota bacterium]
MAKRIIPDLVRHYAEEASFQWIVRERALRSPDHARADIAALDARLEAQLDALLLAGDGGWDICREELKWEEPGEVFTAALMAFQSGDAKRIEAVAEAASAKPGLPRALVSALGWMPWEQAGPLIAKLANLAESEWPVLRYATVGGAAVHRQWESKRMAVALNDKDPLVLARALKACGELGHKATLVAVESHRDSPDEACRFWSRWSTLLLGKKEVASDLLALGGKSGRFRIQALSLALRAVPAAEALAWLDALGAADMRLRIAGLGWIGAAVRVPWLLEQLRTPALARPAGGALTWITGVEFKTGKLGRFPPPGLEEELEEAGLAEAADVDWPWPDADATAQWWQVTGKKFDSSKTYILGRPKGVPAFQDAWAEGKQCHRLGAALELALAQPGTPLPEGRTRAPG